MIWSFNICHTECLHMYAVCDTMVWKHQALTILSFIWDSGKLCLSCALCPLRVAGSGVSTDRSIRIVCRCMHMRVIDWGERAVFKARWLRWGRKAWRDLSGPYSIQCHFTARLNHLESWVEQVIMSAPVAAGSLVWWMWPLWASCKPCLLLKLSN